MSDLFDRSLHELQLFLTTENSVPSEAIHDLVEEIQEKLSTEDRIQLQRQLHHELLQSSDEVFLSAFTRYTPAFLPMLGENQTSASGAVTVPNCPECFDRLCKILYSTQKRHFFREDLFSISLAENDAERMSSYLRHVIPAKLGKKLPKLISKFDEESLAEILLHPEISSDIRRKCIFLSAKEDKAELLDVLLSAEPEFTLENFHSKMTYSASPNVKKILKKKFGTSVMPFSAVLKAISRLNRQAEYLSFLCENINEACEKASQEEKLQLYQQIRQYRRPSEQLLLLANTSSALSFSPLDICKDLFQNTNSEDPKATVRYLDVLQLLKKTGSQMTTTEQNILSVILAGRYKDTSLPLLLECPPSEEIFLPSTTSQFTKLYKQFEHCGELKVGELIDLKQTLNEHMPLFVKMIEEPDLHGSRLFAQGLKNEQLAILCLSQRLYEQPFRLITRYTSFLSQNDRPELSESLKFLAASPIPVDVMIKLVDRPDLCTAYELGILDEKAITLQVDETPTSIERRI